MDRVDETVINYDLIEDILEELFLKAGSTVFVPPCLEDTGNPSVELPTDKESSITGSVLIFLPGIGEIRTLTERLTGSKQFGDSKRFYIIPLHSSLSSTEQKRAFIPSKFGCRKIIISTNIAETSVTIPDVVYVIDSGRFREITRDRRNDTRRLIATWCSKASVKQRSGRAGRVRPGVCLKLYSSLTENQIMKSTTDPELRRIPLEEVCLTILASDFCNSCSDFLSQTPQPPSVDAVQSALNALKDVGAVETFGDDVDPTTRNESLTALGRLLAKLPVDVRVGKMLIYGSLFNCIDSIMTIAASLTASKSPFVTSFENRQELKAVHAHFVQPFSDFLTFVNVWKAYRQSEVLGLGRKFCNENFLNYSTMIEVQDSRRHFLDLLSGLGLIDRTEWEYDEQKLMSCKYNKNCDVDHLVDAIVYAGLFPNVAFFTRTNSVADVSVFHKSEQLFVQSSVNSKISVSPPSSWITFFEKFGTERRVTVSKTAFIPPISLILFGSTLHVLHAERRVRVDDWIDLTASATTGVVFSDVQNRFKDFLTSLFDKLIDTSKTSIFSEKTESVIGLVAKLLSFR
jgi:HrpA-like RNA helicase